MKNILFIVADSLRADTYNLISGIDSVTRAMNSTTELSLPWMLTGHATFNPSDNLPLDLNTQGYSTLLIHSNPIVDRFKHGFDKVVDLHTHHRRARLSRRYNRVRDALQKRLPDIAYKRLKGVIRGPEEKYLPYCRVEDKLTYLDMHPLRPPWFIWLHLMDPHTPYYPVSVSLPVEKIIDTNDNQISAVRGYHIPSVEEVKLWYSLYLEESTEMWQVLEKYLARIDTDETAVIFTADHGEEFGEHGEYGHKGNRYNPENIQVPFFTLGMDLEIKNHSELRKALFCMV